MGNGGPSWKRPQAQADEEEELSEGRPNSFGGGKSSVVPPTLKPKPPPVAQKPPAPKLPGRPLAPTLPTRAGGGGGAPPPPKPPTGGGGLPKNIGQMDLSAAVSSPCEIPLAILLMRPFLWPTVGEASAEAERRLETHTPSCDVTFNSSILTNVMSNCAVGMSSDRALMLAVVHVTSQFVFKPLSSHCIVRGFNQISLKHDGVDRKTSVYCSEQADGVREVWWQVRDCLFYRFLETAC